MGWIPDWVAKPYAKLYVKFRDRSFDFSSGLEALGISDQRFSRVIQELRTEGFLYSGRKATDRRKRYYQLIGPEHAVYAMALRPEEISSVDEKLKAVGGHFAYMVTGGSAASRHHDYVRSSKTDISVFLEDLGFWIAYFTEPGIRISVDGHVSEKGIVEIEIATNLTDDALAEAIEKDGIHIKSREALIVSFLREPTDDNVLDALALLIHGSSDLDWDKLSESDVRQEIGFLMEASNRTANKQAFSLDLVNQFRGRPSLRKVFGQEIAQLDPDNDLAKLAHRGGLQLAVHPRVIKKVVNDLVS